MELINLSRAKPKIGRLIDQALRGETVVIRKGDRMVQLTEFIMPEPIPERPVGHFRRQPDEYELPNRATSSAAAQR